MDLQDLSRLIPGLRFLALRALGDPAVADDVAQEAVTRAISAIQQGQLRDHERLPAFVAGIARHIITDVIRSKQRIHVDVDSQELAAAGPDPLSGLIKAQEKDALRAALLELSESDRDILRLSFEEGLSPQEIGDRLGMTSVVVRKRKSRAIERLRFALAQLRRGRSHDRPASPTKEVMRFRQTIEGA